jgi:hypothetical protein
MGKSQQSLRIGVTWLMQNRKLKQFDQFLAGDSAHIAAYIDQGVSNMPELSHDWQARIKA